MHLILHYAMFSHIFFKKINKFNLYTNIKEKKKIQLQWFCAPANKILTNVIFIFEKYVQFIIKYLLFFKYVLLSI